VEQIRGLKVKGQGHWERKCKNRFRTYPTVSFIL